MKNANSATCFYNQHDSISGWEVFFENHPGVFQLKHIRFLMAKPLALEEPPPFPEVMEWIDGVKLTDAKAIRGLGPEKRAMRSAHSEFGFVLGLSYRCLLEGFLDVSGLGLSWKDGSFWMLAVQVLNRWITSRWVSNAPCDSCSFGFWVTCSSLLCFNPIQNIKKNRF